MNALRDLQEAFQRHSGNDPYLVPALVVCIVALIVMIEIFTNPPKGKR